MQKEKKFHDSFLKMRINIDLPDDIAKQFNVLAAEKDTDRKNYIQELLVLHARGQKIKKPSTKR